MCLGLRRRVRSLACPPQCPDRDHPKNRCGNEYPWKHLESVRPELVDGHTHGRREHADDPI